MLHIDAYIVTGFTMAWLYRQDNSQYWWIGYRINGRQYLRSTRETDRAEAEKLLAQFGTMQEANRAGRPHEEFYLALTQQQQLRRIVLKAAVEEWLTECKVPRRRNPPTV